MLLSLLLAVALAAIRFTDLFGVAMLFGIYSLLTAVLFMDLDAVDVAFTEAAVGAGLSTILLLAGLRLVGRREKAHRRNPLLALLVVGVTGAALIYGLSDAPLVGDPQAPAQQHLAPHYIAHALTETGVPNMVTAVLASYRGFDTLGETLVVFTAGMSVLLLLGIGPGHPPDEDGNDRELTMQRQVVRVILPFILLFALYVQFHGDFGAGGGFQAGVIFATGLVLYDLVFGNRATCRVLSPRWLARCAAGGVLLYAAVGLAGMFAGGAFLDYGVLAADPVSGQHLGILLVEAGVGLTVFSAVSLIYLAFSTRERQT